MIFVINIENVKCVILEEEFENDIIIKKIKLYNNVEINVHVFENLDNS